MTMTDPRPRERSRRAGFTLVELMIAIGLMLIITAQLNIIFAQSQKLFTGANALVEVFSNERQALDTLERDISNIQKTSQMEFFKDNITRPYGYGIYNTGEELGTIAPRFFDGVSYIYGMALKQNVVYQPVNYKDGGPYRRDAIYFRTMTLVDGHQRDSLVEYDLWVGDIATTPRPRPILRRHLWYIDSIDASGTPHVTAVAPSDICYYVEEFKVEYFLRDKRRGGIGRFYSAKESTLGNAPAGDPTPPNLYNFGNGGAFGVQCVSMSQNGIFGQLSTFDGSLTINGDSIPEIAPGDQMYVLTHPTGATQVPMDFLHPLHIRTVTLLSPTQVNVQFDEQPLIMQQMTPAATGGAPTLDCEWRSAWLPSAVRITIKIKDARGIEIRTLQRVFQILRT